LGAARYNIKTLNLAAALRYVSSHSKYKVVRKLRSSDTLGEFNRRPSLVSFSFFFDKEKEKRN